jgi:hypothetical protein
VSDLLQFEVQRLLHGVVELLILVTWMIFIYHNVLFYDLHMHEKKLKFLNILYIFSTITSKTHSNFKKIVQCMKISQLVIDTFLHLLKI